VVVEPMVLETRRPNLVYSRDFIVAHCKSWIIECRVHVVSVILNFLMPAVAFMGFRFQPTRTSNLAFSGLTKLRAKIQAVIAMTAEARENVGPSNAFRIAHAIAMTDIENARI